MAFVPVRSGRPERTPVVLGVCRPWLGFELRCCGLGCVDGGGSVFVDVDECDGTKGVMLVHDVMRLHTGREGGAETRAITGRST